MRKMASCWWHHGSGLHPGGVISGWLFGGEGMHHVTESTTSCRKLRGEGGARAGWLGEGGAWGRLGEGSARAG